MPLQISVIIPAINEAHCLPRAVNCAWEAGVDEIVVVDGGSRDATPEIARKLGARLVSSRAGRACQQNAGARDATGDVLLFLHADNWLGADSGNQIRGTMADPQVGCGAFRQRIDGDGRFFRWLEWGNAARVRWWGLPYGDQGIFVRRDVFHSVGGFPELRLMEDLVLMRAIRRHHRPVLLPGPLFVDPRRWRRHGALRQTLRNWLLLSAYYCGISPNRLARFYARHDGPS